MWSVLKIKMSETSAWQVSIGKENKKRICSLANVFAQNEPTKTETWALHFVTGCTQNAMKDAKKGNA